MQNSINLCVQRSFRQSMLMLDGLRSRLRAVPLQPGTSSRRTTMKAAWSLPLLSLRTGKMVTMFPHRGSFSLIPLSCVGQPDSGSLIRIRPRGPSEPTPHRRQSFFESHLGRQRLVNLVIDAAGKVRSAKMVGADDEKMINATAVWKFIPAFRVARAVAYQTRLTVAPLRCMSGA